MVLAQELDSGAIIFACHSPESEKLRRTAALFPDAQIIPQRPLTPESEINYSVTQPEYTAALKAVQRLRTSEVQDYLRGVIAANTAFVGPESTVDVMLSQLAERGGYRYSATDVTTDIESVNFDPSIHAHQPGGRGVSNLYDELYPYMVLPATGVGGGITYTQAHMRVGFASLEVHVQTHDNGILEITRLVGKLGRVTSHFMYQNLTPDELREYIASAGPQAMKVNAGVMWEHLAHKIAVIDGVGQDDPDFPFVMSKFISRSKGVPEELRWMMLRKGQETVEPSDQAKMTSEMRRLCRTHFADLGLTQHIEWRPWYPRKNDRFDENE